MGGDFPGQPLADAWSDLLQSASLESTAVAAGIFDESGCARELNPGMRRLLGGRRVGDITAAYFANPSFRDLWHRTAGDRVFEGELSLGDGKRVNRSIRAQAWRRSGQLEILGEVDVVELDSLNERLIELNRNISHLERELIKKNRLLEQSFDVIARKERLNAALAEVSSAIERHGDEPSLLRELCEITVTRGGFMLAAVVVPNKDGVFESKAAAGHTAYLKDLRTQLDPSIAEGQGPTAQAYRTATAQVINDFDASDATAPWHARARRHGVAASAALPLVGASGVLGSFNIYADAKGYFGEDEVQALQKIATDVALALEVLRQKDALRESQERYRQIFEHAPVGVVHYDGSGTIVDCNDAYVAILGSSRERILGINLLSEPEDPRVVDAVRRSLSEGSGFVDIVYRSLTVAKITPIRAFFGGIWNEAGEISAGMAIVEDCSDRHALETSLRRSEERFRLAVDAAGIGVWDYDIASHQLLWDDWMLRLHGLASGTAPRDLAAWRRLVHPEDRAQVLRQLAAALRSQTTASTDMRVIRADGELRHLRLFARVAPNNAGQPARFTGVCYDVTEQQLAAERIRRLAFYDPLTNLANRRLLFDRLEHALARTQRLAEHGALLLLDLDGFKRVNDSRGHDVGDELLIELANRLRDEVRRVDTVARLGGDEFVVLFEGLSASPEMADQQATTLATKLAQLANQPYVLASALDTAFHCAASIGIAVFDGRSRSATEVMKEADIAMFEAKRGGRNTIRTFRTQMLQAIEAEEALADALRKAMERDELYLLYQPQVDQYGNWFGCEVLLRWAPPDGRLLSPVNFLAVAEASDLVKAIDDWVLKRACTQLEGLGPLLESHGLSVGINVSARQFADPEFVDKVLSMTEPAKLGHCRLKIEVKEQVLFADLAHATGTLRRLGEAGIGVGVDDFGSGFSSLPLMRKLPLQVIKIDQALTRGGATEPEDLSLLRAAIAAARALSLPIIAEGVEHKSQYEMLLAEGCTRFQGYYFERPLPFEEFAKRLRKQLERH